MKPLGSLGSMGPMGPMGSSPSSPWLGSRLRMPLLLLAVLILQPVVDQVSFAHVHADLFLLFAVGAGLVGGAERGGLWGFAAGLLADLQPVTTPFGLNALVLTLVGFAVGQGSEALVRGPWWLATAVTTAASAAGTLLYVAVALLVGQGGMLAEVRTVATVVGVVAIADGVLSLPMLPVIRWAAGRPRSARQVMV